MPVGPHDEWVKRYGWWSSDYQHPVKEATLRHFADHNKEFQAACEHAGVKPTRRQASKFRRKMGSAYEAMRYVVARPA